jgi:putative lipoic acid-binding regulatory protein
MDNPGGNGEGKTCNLFDRQSVNYPVSFDLKAIIDANIDEEESKKNLEKVFKATKVPHTNWRVKSSSGGKYKSYTVSVDVDNKEMLHKLYADLKKVPGLKFAL